MNKQHEMQTAYTIELDKVSTAVQIVVPKAFVRGMRDLGYKDPAKALAELVDNAKEAGATRVDIIFGYEPKDKNKTRPVSVAVWDNGDGMIKRMIPRAMTWGGTSRENSRDGFGRYGFGLPASCVSIGTKFSVYSKVKGETLQSVTVDLEDVANQSGSYTVADPQDAEMPAFVKEYLSEHGLADKHQSCTLVLIEKCDNFTRSTTKGLTNLFAEHFGVTYHQVRRDFDIFVDGKAVEALDPLFTTPNARFFDLDEDRAQAYEPIKIDFKDQNTREVVGQITVRFALLPATFHLKDKSKAASKSNLNGRWSVMRSHTGLVVSRNGRVIDVINVLDGRRLNNNNDRFVRVELDFDATLDEYFGVTTSKQQASIDPRVLELLKRDGFWVTLQNLRKANSNQRAEQELIQANDDDPDNNTAIAVANKAAAIFKETPAARERKETEGKTNLLNQAKANAKVTKRTVDEEVQILEATASKTKFQTKLESAIGGPFFRVELIGGMTTLHINKEHRFFTDIYMSQEATTRTRNALELLLLAIGWCMEEASDDARHVYKVEVPEWSKKLDLMLDMLSEAQDPKDLEADEDESLNSSDQNVA